MTLTLYTPARVGVQANEAEVPAHPSGKPVYAKVRGAVPPEAVALNQIWVPSVELSSLTLSAVSVGRGLTSIESVVELLLGPPVMLVAVTETLSVPAEAAVQFSTEELLLGFTP